MRRRKSKSIRTIAGLYDFAPGKPEVMTAMLKSLYRAVARITRKRFYDVLDTIERDYKAGHRYWCE